MLGDECPNDSCFGIPLVRPPNKPNGERDPRKVRIEAFLQVIWSNRVELQECVVCGNVYMPQSTVPTQPPLETPVILRQEGRSLAPVQQPIVQTPPSIPKQIIVRFIDLAAK
jgi:uncharacterized OB-fold protein